MRAHARTRLIPNLPGLPIGTWLRLAAERRQLRKLEPRMLRDIGLDPAEAYREAARPFWDVPRGR